MRPFINTLIASILSPIASFAMAYPVTVTVSDPPIIMGAVESALAQITITENYPDALQSGYFTLFHFETPDDPLSFTDASYVSGSGTHIEFNSAPSGRGAAIYVETDNSRIDTITVQLYAVPLFFPGLLGNVTLTLGENEALIPEGGVATGLGGFSQDLLVAHFGGYCCIYIGDTPTLELQVGESVTLPLVHDHPSYVEVSSFDPRIASVESVSVNAVEILGVKPGTTRIQAWNPLGEGGYITVTVTSASMSSLIGGTVSGLAGSGLVLQNNGGDDLAIAADGGFTFPAAQADGSDYNVTVHTQPVSPAQTCTVSNGIGTVAGSDVTNVQIDCMTPSPALTLTKALTNNADEDLSGTVSLGDTLTYSVSATNAGNVTLTNVTLSDPLLSGTGGTTPCVSVTPGAGCTLIGTYTVQAADVNAGKIVNTATADADQLAIAVTAKVTTSVSSPEPKQEPQDIEVSTRVVQPGLVDDVRIARTGILEGSTIQGTVTNAGEVRDVTLLPGARIEGGRVGGSLRGQAGAPGLVNAFLAHDAVVEHVRLGPNTVIDPAARFGPGVCFEQTTTIPAGFDLGRMLSSDTWESSPQVPVFKLNQALLCGDPDGTVLRDLQQALLFGAAGDELSQDPVSSALKIRLGEASALMLPVGVSRTENEAVPGVTITEDGEALLVTESGEAVLCLPLPWDLLQAQELLTARQLALTFDTRGSLLLTDGEVTVKARMDYVVLTAAAGTGPGVRVFPVEQPANRMGASLVFETEAGLLEQRLVPEPGDWPALKAALHRVAGVEAASLDTTGMIRVMIDNQVVRAMADFTILPGAVEASGEVKFEPVGDLNGDGTNDFMMTFPNGDQQILYLLP